MDTTMRRLLVVALAVALLVFGAVYLRRTRTTPVAGIVPTPAEPAAADQTSAAAGPNSPTAKALSPSPPRPPIAGLGPGPVESQPLDVLRDRLSSPTVRNNAANRLLNERDPQLASELIRMLKDETESVTWRNYCVQFLRGCYEQASTKFGK